MIKEEKPFEQEKKLFEYATKITESKETKNDVDFLCNEAKRKANGNLKEALSILKRVYSL